jgi:hypothetical protein
MNIKGVACDSQPETVCCVHYGPGCTFDSVLIRLRKMLKDETPEEKPKQADEA